MGNGYKGLFWHSSKYKLASLLIPKNATTSVKWSMGITGQIAIGYDEACDKKYTKIVILRNPLNKFISGYLEVIKRKRPKTKKREFYAEGDDKQKRFKKFITEVEKNGLFDEHIQLQHYAMTDLNGDMYQFDYILVLEHIGKDWAKMCKDSGKKISLPKNNSGNKKDFNQLKELIDSDEDLQKRIDVILEKDWEIYDKIISDRNE